MKKLSFNIDYQFHTAQASHRLTLQELSRLLKNLQESFTFDKILEPNERNFLKQQLLREKSRVGMVDDKIQYKV